MSATLLAWVAGFGLAGPAWADNWGSPSTWGSMVWTDRCSGADAYTYDAYGRLASVAFGCGGSITYSYDAAGNRTQVYKAP